jgi:hypothetical protein
VAQGSVSAGLHESFSVSESLRAPRRCDHFRIERAERREVVFLENSLAGANPIGVGLERLGLDQGRRTDLL